ncbi:MAG TPA: tetratricopeptide repeat protein [Candidatus Binatia bacterium]
MKRHALILGCFAVLFTVEILAAFREKSPTVDEGYHLFAGYTHLKWGDFRAYPEHPPLAKMLAALPLLALDIKDPRRAPYWDRLAQERQYNYRLAGFMVFRDNDPEKILFYSKLPLIAVAVALGIFVYVWAGELYGAAGAIAALALYALDPNVLAHASIAQTDMAFAAFFFIASYFFFRCLKLLTWRDLACASLCCGLAAVTKFSFAAIFAIWLVAIVVRVFSQEPLGSKIIIKGEVASRGRKTALLAAVFASALLVTYASIWAIYLFRWDAVLGGGTHFPLEPVLPSSGLGRAAAEWIAGARLFPEAAVYGVLYVAKTIHRASYLLGEVSTEGFWMYFPVAFAVKTPPPALLLLVAAICLWARGRRITTAEGFLALSAVAYFAFAVASRMNIGLRHILPVYPFLYVLLGGVAAALWKSRLRAAQALVCVLAVWLAAGLARVHPDLLAYFNELAGGSSNGYKILVDSNLDWGQDLKSLKNYVDKNKLEPVYLNYFGTADPCYYGLRFVDLPKLYAPPLACPQSPPSAPPGFIAVSATNLVSTYLRYLHSYDWLMRRTPVARIGESIFVYDIRGDAEAHKHLAFLYLREAMVKDAQREFAFAGEPKSEKQLADFDIGNSPEAYGALGVAFFENGMLDGAVVAFRRALLLNPADSDMHNNLGIVYIRQGKFEPAIGAFKLALKTDPNNAEAYNQLGNVYLKLGRGSDAIAAYREALRLDADHREAREALQRATPGK